MAGTNDFVYRVEHLTKSYDNKLLAKSELSVQSKTT